MPSETEASLIICANDPGTIYENIISQLKSLPNYKLRENKNQEIREFYFDKPEKTLQQKRIVFRIRIIDEMPFISLKGPVTENNNDYVVQ